jgi:hypothetical protein
MLEGATVVAFDCLVTFETVIIEAVKVGGEMWQNSGSSSYHKRSFAASRQKNSSNCHSSALCVPPFSLLHHHLLCFHADDASIHCASFSFGLNLSLLMFRIISPKGSVQLRSAVSLRYIRLFHRCQIAHSTKVGSANAFQEENPLKFVSHIETSNSESQTVPVADQVGSTLCEQTQNGLEVKAKARRPRKSAAENLKEGKLKSHRSRKPVVEDGIANKPKLRQRKSQKPTTDNKSGESSEKPKSRYTKKPPIIDEEGAVHSIRPHGSRIFKAPGGPRQNIAQYMAWVHGGKLVGRSIGDKKRMNIVGEKLCGKFSG